MSECAEGRKGRKGKIIDRIGSEWIDGAISCLFVYLFFQGPHASGRAGRDGVWLFACASRWRYSTRRAGVEVIYEFQNRALKKW